MLAKQLTVIHEVRSELFRRVELEHLCEIEYTQLVLIKSRQHELASAGCRRWQVVKEGRRVFQLHTGRKL